MHNNFDDFQAAKSRGITVNTHNAEIRVDNALNNDVPNVVTHKYKFTVVDPHKKSKGVIKGGGADPNKLPKETGARFEKEKKQPAIKIDFGKQASKMLKSIMSVKSAMSTSKSRALSLRQKGSMVQQVFKSPGLINWQTVSNRYKMAHEDLDYEFLPQGWNLNNPERIEAFSYGTAIVRLSQDTPVREVTPVCCTSFCGGCPTGPAR